jgi:hypothetical protein
MLRESVTKIALAGVIAVASMSPTLAAKMTPKPCAKPELRCVADCGRDHWCRVYACSFNQTMLMPIPCNDQNGGCFAPRC